MVVVVHKQSDLHVLFFCTFCKHALCILSCVEYLYFALCASYVYRGYGAFCTACNMHYGFAFAKFAHPGLHLLSLHATYPSLGKSSKRNMEILMTFAIRCRTPLPLPPSPIMALFSIHIFFNPSLGALILILGTK